MTIANNTNSKLEDRENRALLWKETIEYITIYSVFTTLPSAVARYPTAH